MEQVKPWWKSATIWAIVFSAAAFLASRFLGVQPEDIQVPTNPDFNELKAIADQVKEAKGNVFQIVGIVIGSLSSIIAIWNRATAKAKLSSSTDTTTTRMS